MGVIKSRKTKNKTSEETVGEKAGLLMLLIILKTVL